MSRYEEYLICKRRKHQKSGRVLNGWDVCEYCGTYFHYVTMMEESNVPEA